MHCSAVRDEDFYSLGGRITPGRAGAVERQETLGWKPRADVEPWMVVDPIDWTANPYDDRNWFAQVHGWRVMDAYLRDYRATGDGAVLERVAGWMLAWAKYRRGVPPEISRLLDPISGMRATRIAVVLDAVLPGDLEISERERDGLWALATEQATWLYTPGHIVMMNHAYFQVLGLELLCRVLHDQPWAAQARTYAIETFDRFVQTQFHRGGRPCGEHPELPPTATSTCKTAPPPSPANSTPAEHWSSRRPAVRGAPSSCPPRSWPS